jgi:hypothetical protein
MSVIGKELPLSVGQGTNGSILCCCGGPVSTMCHAPCARNACCAVLCRAVLCMLQLDEAVTAIKAAMIWDEAAFGREYDLVSYRPAGSHAACISGTCISASSVND